MEPKGYFMQNNAHQEFLKRYQAIHAPFVRYCSSRAFGIMAAEDLVQEAVLVALQGFDKIKDPEKLLSFLIGTVNNILRNKRRKEKYAESWQDHFAEKVAHKSISPEVTLDIEILLRAMKKLPARQEEALLLFEISGFSIREIAEIQESSEGAVKTRLSRARQALKEQFTERTEQRSLSAALAALAILLMG